MAHQVVTDYTNYAENAHVKVYVRARPLDPKDEDAKDLFELGKDETGKNRKITMKQWKREDGAPTDWGGVGSNAFAFDGLFWTDAEQREVFDAVVRDQVDHVLKGFNACCFAYGQTGSGKTHSMFFPSGGQDRRNKGQAGMIPQAVNHLFAQLRERRMDMAEVHVSFLEIYCDTLRDLGKAAASENFKTTSIYRDARKSRLETFGRGLRKSDSGSKTLSKDPSRESTGAPSVKSLTVTPNNNTATTTTTATATATANHHHHAASPRADQDVNPSDHVDAAQDHYDELKEEIREDADGNVFVKGLAQIPVTSCKEVLEIIDKGLRLRATEATRMNDTSSRSHTVFTIEVRVEAPDPAEKRLVGRLHLVDLAGSERLKKSESSGIRLQEALHINKSLTALGKVIVALDPVERKKGAHPHVPYRDSKLTRLLQNSIGGDSYTSLLATIRPALNHAEECLSTLQFANRCRRVANHPTVHRVSETHEDRIKERDKLVKSLLHEIQLLKDKNRKLREHLAQLLGVSVEDLNDESSTALAGAVAAGGVLSTMGDPHVVQAVVSQAVLAALRAVGIQGASIDPATGCVRLADGRTLDATNLNTLTKSLAQLGLKNKNKRRQTSSSSNNSNNNIIPRDSAGHSASSVVAAIATRIAKVFGWPLTAIPPQLVDILREREDELAHLKVKLDLGKSEKAAADAEMWQLRADAISAQLAQRTTLSRAKRDQDRLAREHSEQLREAREANDRAVATVLHESKVWFDDNNANALKRDESLQSQRDTKVAQLQTLTRDLALAREDAARNAALVANTEGTVEALRAQYDHWLAEKDREAVTFVQQLNAYRAYKRTQLHAADVELNLLWTALETHTALLRRVRQGRYPLHQLGSNHAAPQVPAADLPRQDLALARLPATKRALRRAKTQRIKSPHSEAAQGSSSAQRLLEDIEVTDLLSATTPIGSVASSAGGNHSSHNKDLKQMMMMTTTAPQPGRPATAENLFYNVPRTSPRSRSMGASHHAASPSNRAVVKTDPRRRKAKALPQYDALAASAPATLGGMLDDDDDDNEDEDGNGHPDVADGDDAAEDSLFTVGADVEAASPAQLRAMVREARTELVREQGRTEKKVRERVARELAAHSTVEYMRSLERAKADAEAKASDANRRYAQLRVAYESQLRQQDNSREVIRTATFAGASSRNNHQNSRLISGLMSHNNNALPQGAPPRRPASAAATRRS